MKELPTECGIYISAGMANNVDFAFLFVLTRGVTGLLDPTVWRNARGGELTAAQMDNLRRFNETEGLARLVAEVIK